jgi:hypothetical protein
MRGAGERTGWYEKAKGNLWRLICPIMVKIRSCRSKTVRPMALAVAFSFVLGACSQSRQDADLEQKIAAADARTAAAEKRTRMATQTSATGSAFAKMPSGAANPPVGEPVDNAAPAIAGEGSSDGVHYAPANRTGPTNADP